MRIGGPARFFVSVKSEEELVAAIRSAEAAGLKWTVVGEGSNLVAADKGFEGVVIQNKIEKFELPPRLAGAPAKRATSSLIKGGERGSSVMVGGGNNLLKFIFKLNRLGLSGMEKMAGIPGTVGGAVYGCAGAYGQEIKDRLVKARVFDGKKFRWISKARCGFGYRHSAFKHKKNRIITAAVFELEKGAKGLMGTSKGIIKLREKKYPPGLRCPGSFFANIKLADLPVRTRRPFTKKIPQDKIMFGKVPAGYLLDEIGAKGMRQGGIRVASHHGNLIYNPNGGSARDVEKLARRLKSRVKKKFGIMIEEEVQYLRSTN